MERFRNGIISCIIIGSFLFGILGYIYIHAYLVSWIRKYFYNVDSGIFVIDSNNIFTFVEYIWNGFVVASVILFVLLYTVMLFKIIEEDLLLNIEGMKSRGSILVLIVMFCSAIILFTLTASNYCIVKEDGLIIRDIATLFQEKRYGWNEIDEIEIKDHWYKGSYHAEYNIVINQAKYNLNDRIMSQYLGNGNYWTGIEKVHSLAKEHEVKINNSIKEVNKYNEELISIINE